MSIKILGGVARGFSLNVPKDQSYLRPTSVILRRKIFDWRQNWESFCLVDLCAGTGAMGMEALSRGADQVDFVEKDKLNLKCVEGNLSKLIAQIPSFEARSRAFNYGFEKYIQTRAWEKLQSVEPKKIVLFFDPPYEDLVAYNRFIDLMKNIDFLGEIWIESDESKGIKSDILKKSFSLLTKEVCQGSHFILMGKLR